MDYNEKEIKKNIRRNEQYINEFKKWLQKKNLGEKTIRKHIDNTTFFLNEYLHYYDIVTMEDGIAEVYSYLSGWFIEKCMWASKTSIKDNATSLKKFYQCMSEYEYVEKEEYKLLCQMLKEHMDDILEILYKFDNELDEFYLGEDFDL